MMKNRILVISLLLLMSVAAYLAADDTNDSEKQRFVNRIIDGAKLRARHTGQVLVVIENKDYAIIIYIKQNKFTGVSCQPRKREIGISLAGNEFLFLNKENSRIIKYKHASRYSACYADSNSIKVRKDYFRMDRAIVVKSNLEFYEAFYTNPKRISGGNTFLLDVQIHNYQSK